MKKYTARLLAIIVLLSTSLSTTLANDIPATATKLLPTPLRDTSIMEFNGFGDTHTKTILENADYPDAIRVSIAHKTKQTWDTEIRTGKNTDPVNKGDVILVSFDTRCIATQDESGSGRIQVYVAQMSPWTSILSKQIVVGSEWKRFYVSGRAKENFAADTLWLTMQLGHYAQTLDIANLQVHNLGNVADAEVPRNIITYKGREKDAPWRAAAQKRIEELRKSDITLTVMNNGKPVPNAKISIEQTRHAFGFGTFTGFNLTKDNADAQKRRDFILKNFNRITAPLYWNWVWVNPANRKSAIDIVDWANENHLTVKGHAMIWPGLSEHHDKMPKKVRQLKDDPTALSKAIFDHIEDSLTTLKDKNIAEWDLMNEPRFFHDVMDILGDEIAAEWYNKAAKLDPAPLYILNENQILNTGGYTNTQQDNLIHWIKTIQNNGGNLDGIGFQCHIDEMMAGPERVYEILDRFAQFDLPLQVTEYDLTLPNGHETLAAEYTTDFLTICFSHPAMQSFTIWGFWEGDHWKPEAAMVKKDWTLTPEGKALTRLITDTWWTSKNGTTNSNGKFTTRAFKGTHTVTVENNGKKTTKDIVAYDDNTNFIIEL